MNQSKKLEKGRETNTHQYPFSARSAACFRSSRVFTRGTRKKNSGLEGAGASTAYLAQAHEDSGAEETNGKAAVDGILILL